MDFLKKIRGGYIFFSVIRMTTFIKAKLKKSDEHSQIQSSCKNYRMSYYIKINLPKNHHSKIHDDKAIISCKNVKNVHV